MTGSCVQFYRIEYTLVVLQLGLVNTLQVDSNLLLII